MKKFVFGCLGIALVLGIAGVFGAYFFVWKPAKAFVLEAAKLQELPKLEAQIKNTAAFTAPANAELTGPGVDRFLRVQESVETKLGARLKQLDAKYKAINPGNDPKYRPALGEVVGALKDLGGLVVEAKRWQVEALNQQKFSLAEYDWTRARVYQAAGVPIDLRFERAIRAAARGEKIEMDDVAGPEKAEVPAKNRELVAPHAEKLRERAPLAFFGL